MTFHRFLGDIESIGNFMVPKPVFFVELKYGFTGRGQRCNELVQPTDTFADQFIVFGNGGPDGLFPEFLQEVASSLILSVLVNETGIGFPIKVSLDRFADAEFLPFDPDFHKDILNNIFGHIQILGKGPNINDHGFIMFLEQVIVRLKIVLLNFFYQLLVLHMALGDITKYTEIISPC